MANTFNIKLKKITDILSSMNYSVIPDIIQDENNIPASSNNFAYSIMPKKVNKFILTSNCIETYSFEIRVYYKCKTEAEKTNSFINFINLIESLNELEKVIDNIFELINSKSYQFRGILRFNY